MLIGDQRGDAEKVTSSNEFVASSGSVGINWEDHLTDLNILIVQTSPWSAKGSLSHLFLTRFWMLFPDGCIWRYVYPSPFDKTHCRTKIPISMLLSCISIQFMKWFYTVVHTGKGFSLTPKSILACSYLPGWVFYGNKMLCINGFKDLCKAYYLRLIYACGCIQWNTKI